MTSAAAARGKCPQVLENSLEARVLQSDNSALAKDCRREMRTLNQRLLKLGESCRQQAGQGGAPYPATIPPRCIVWHRRPPEQGLQAMHCLWLQAAVAYVQQTTPVLVQQASRQHKQGPGLCACSGSLLCLLRLSAERQ